MLSKSQISLVKSLKQKKFRNQLGLFVVEGDKIVNELICSSYKVKEIYATQNWIETNKAILTSYKSEFQLNTINEKELNKLSFLKCPNGVLALAYQNKAKEHKLFSGSTFALDGIQDPGNLGTILRTLDWFGVSQLFALPNCVDQYNDKVVQASMGSIFRVEFIEISMEELLNKYDSRLVLADLGGDNIYNYKFNGNEIVILGNEGSGLGEDLKKSVNKRVSIQKIGKAESLNVGISSAIICSEIIRQNSPLK
ncbi:MAG: TrmH family RNA methyltransferase [Sphingobacteriales bacterium]|jgi:TrmH family RNA methyltransferase